MSDMEFVQKSKKDVWQTPEELWAPIDTRDEITLDPCAGPETMIGQANYRVEKGHNGLTKNWAGVIWLNPPFSNKEAWLAKAQKEYEHDKIRRAYIVTPDSTDVKSWWHEQLAEFCDWVWFPKGRIDYVNPETGEQNLACRLALLSILLVSHLKSSSLDGQNETDARYNR
jgi:DNA N-6-adenine-methyltransferase (Dam).